MSKKFYKTIIQIEVLSEHPLDDAYSNDLDAISYAITEGDCSGKIETIRQQELTGKMMAKALAAQGSDPSFFGLNPDGSMMED